MITATRWRLTLFNAIVMFVVLLLLGGSVYIFLKQQLYANIDLALMEQSKRYPAVMAQNTTQAILVVRMAVAERNVTMLPWDSQGGLLSGAVALYSPKVVEQFRRQLGRSRPVTVKVDGQSYRVMSAPANVAYPVPVLQPIYDENEVQPAPAVSVQKLDAALAADNWQFIMNVTAEEAMMQSLLWVMIGGSAAGLVAAVAGGYVLANRALVPIRSSWEKQQQFVADASHELRTPLSVVQAHTEILLRHPCRTIEEESRHVSAILRETKRLNKLVSGLLTLARSDSNQLELYKSAISLDGILKDVAESFVPLAEMKDILIATDLDERIQLQADEERLRQLFVILLDNALKYTPEQGLIRLRLQKLSHSVHIQVTDTGVGIASRDLPHIFDRFYRADRPRTRQEGGTGLGLAIARWIVEKHGGRISADSRPGTGTTIHLHLPL